jgi:hypothetical protein
LLFIRKLGGNMGLNDTLAAKRGVVLERWFQAVLATYPEDTSRFLASGADPFANPVGHTVREGLGRLYDRLVADVPVSELSSAIDGIVRIRAVQEFTPSAAVGFVYTLRGILREELADAALDPPGQAALERGVDRLALVAFDVYMQCREKIFEIRVREIKESQLLAARLG